MVNSVSFGNITTDPTRKLSLDTITKPQSYLTPSTTTAATNVQGDSFNKKGKGKKALGFVALLASTVAALGILAKTGKLNKIADLADDAPFLKKAHNAAAKAGDWIGDQAISIFNKAKEAIPFLKKEATDVSNKI